jgi:hypothetical protein
MGLDGWSTSNYLNLGSPADIAGDTTGTISIWIYRDVSLTGTSGAYSVTDASAVNSDYITLNGTSSTKTQFILRTTSTTAIAINGTIALTANVWSNVMVTQDGSAGCKMYVNNSQSGSTDTNTEWLSSLANLDTWNIGLQDRDTDTAWVTPLCEGAYWNVELNTAERQAVVDGVSPAIIRPTALKQYNPMMSRPNVNFMARGRLATENGTLTAVAHCDTIRYPTVPWSPSLAAGGAPPASALPAGSLALMGVGI